MSIDIGGVDITQPYVDVLFEEDETKSCSNFVAEDVVDDDVEESVEEDAE